MTDAELAKVGPLTLHSKWHWDTSEGDEVFLSTHVTERRVVAMDPSFSKVIYFGAVQIVVDPYSGAVNGETTVNVLNSVDFITSYEKSVCIGSA